MEDIMKKRVKGSVDKEAKIVLKNNYIYSGKITGGDDNYLEILDYKSGSYHVFDLENIKDLEVFA